MHRINYQEGRFIRYRVNREKISVGIDQNDHLFLALGDVVEYDGYVLKHAGRTISAPRLRAACQEGWLVPEGAPNRVGQPRRANIHMHSATDAGNDGRGRQYQPATVSDEEKMVGRWRDIREAGEQGVPVRTLQTPTKPESVDVANADAFRAAQEKTQVKAPPRRSTHGYGSESYEALIPDAANAGVHYPPAHVSHPDAHYQSPHRGRTAPQRYSQPPNYNPAPPQHYRQPAPPAPAPASDADSFGFYED